MLEVGAAVEQEAMTASEVEAVAMADGGGDGVTLFGHARQGGGREKRARKGEWGVGEVGRERQERRFELGGGEVGREVEVGEMGCGGRGEEGSGEGGVVEDG